MTNNPRYTLGTEANRIFMASETYELLKFGKGFPAPDGGSGWLNADGTLDPSHGVETWITSRMAHVYSIGAMLGYPGAGELADAALKGVAATSDKERDAKFAAAAKLVSEDAPADWLFNYRITTATAKGVEGFPFDLNQTVLPLYNVTYTK